ncbi:MAG: hypothetical protein FWD54_03515 [Endomicrobia bacterium]|nr:hypothetical protein [Endomicrobiia bacterium]MCL2799330.1 hypothetical protein [Endomicrobiia bacterium]
MFSKYFLALFTTLFFGPGVGHLFLKQYKKAAALIGISILVLIVVAIIMSFSIDLNSVPKDYGAMREYLRNFLSQNSNMMLMINIPLALVWAYSFADIGRSLYGEYKEYKNTESEK